MLARVISVGIIVFWLVMMTCLVRTELLHSTPLKYAVSMDKVMQRIFDSDEPSDLTIYYQGNAIGTCSLQISRHKQPPAAGYLVRSDLKLSFDVFGKPVRLQSQTDSEFDPQYQMTRFHSHTDSGDTRMEMQGDLASKEIQFVLDFGKDYREKHTLPFATVEQMGPSSAMGLFGLGGLQSPSAGSNAKGGSMVPSFSRGPNGPTTFAEETPLVLGGEKVSTWMVHTRYDDSLWSKVYIDSQGQILKVETSFGVTMLGAQFSGANKN